MSFIINQNFDLKSPQFNFARDYFADIATLKAASEDNFPDHFITNVAGTLYQLTKSNSVDETTGKWRELKFGLTSGEVDDKLVDLTLNTVIGHNKKNSTDAEDIGLTIANSDGSINEYNEFPEVSNTLNGVMTPAQKKALEAATSKLAGIAEGANKTVVETEVTSNSSNPVSSKAIYIHVADAISSVMSSIATQIEVCDENTIDSIFDGTYGKTV